MKTWTPMKVVAVGKVTDVVMGGGRHSGRGGYGSGRSNRSSRSFSFPWFPGQR